MEDAVFTFDTKQMQSAMNTIAESLTGLTKMIEGITTRAGKKVTDGTHKATETTKKKTKEVGNAVKTSVSNFSEGSSKMISMMTKKLIGLAAAYVSLKAVMQHIPEIGKTFQHAGDIIMRNLLWPLRKLLIPMLQKILDWTREHRAMFVRWGTYIANAFRTVYQIVQGVIGLVKTFVDSFMKTFENIFGKVTGGMESTVNIIMFKLTALFMYVMELLKPWAETLGKMVATLTKYFSSLWDGIKEGMGNMSKPMEDMISMLQRLWQVQSDLIDSSGALASGFRVVGNIVGGVVNTAVVLLAQSFDILGQAISGATKMYLLWQASREEDTEKYRSLLAEAKKADEEFLERSKNRWSQWWSDMKKMGVNVGDIVTQNTPEDQARLEKEAEEKIKQIQLKVKEKKAEIAKERLTKVESSVKMSDIHITVRNLTDVKTIGKDLAGSIEYSLKNSLRKNLNDAQEGVAH